VLGKCTKASQRKGKGDSPGILSPEAKELLELRLQFPLRQKVDKK
jgi:hypothetical protein